MRNLTTTLALILLLSGCGGGGSGGGKSKQDYNTSEGVRIAHSALDGSPVLAILDGKPLSDTALAFNNISPFYSIKEGRHELVLQEEGGGVQRKVFFNFQDGEKFTVLFAGNNLTSSVIQEETSDSNKEDATKKCPTTFIHGVSNSDSLQIVLNGVAGGHIAPLSVSRAIALTAGENQITLLSDQGTIVWKGIVTCKEKENHAVLVSGKANYFVTGISIP